MTANQSLIQRQTAITHSQAIGPCCLTATDVNPMVNAVSKGHDSERDKLLIRLLFEKGLRVSAALQITPLASPAFRVMTCAADQGNCQKTRLVGDFAMNLAECLFAYAYRKGLRA